MTAAAPTNTAKMTQAIARIAAIELSSRCGPSYRDPQRPLELPVSISQPDIGEMRLEQVMSVLGKPIRLTILQSLLKSSHEWDHPCACFGFDRPKSTLTHHYKVLREAGLITQRQYGLERRSRVRVDEISDRFLGLIEPLLEWTSAGDAAPQ